MPRHHTYFKQIVDILLTGAPACREGSGRRHPHHQEGSCGRCHPRHRLHPRRARLRWSVPPAVQGYLSLASKEFHCPPSPSGKPARREGSPRVEATLLARSFIAHRRHLAGLFAEMGALEQWMAVDHLEISQLP
ncbi:hypothetical protein PVAP13_9KG149400 [Panicum virgatum]|uniref:Uncharacterized protein n=1 Tax=Panicum virgatum TaxID=38727 RepID=A0A8T0NG45_PANVG|nr:hypothetical protein PVAP13_9KG149400 [Panicum virgatum]